MSSDNTQQIDAIDVWVGGAVSGLVAGVLMGLVLHFGADMIELLGGLAPVAEPAVEVGWVVHLAISVGFGLLFAVAISRPWIFERLDSFDGFVIAGLLYGAFIGIVAGGLLFPVAMERAAVGSLPLPFLPVPGVASELFAAMIFAVGHLVYGLALGTIFATIAGVTPAFVAERLPAHE